MTALITLMGKLVALDGQILIPGVYDGIKPASDDEPEAEADDSDMDDATDNSSSEEDDNEDEEPAAGDSTTAEKVSTCSSSPSCEY